MKNETDFHVDRVYGFLRILLAFLVFGVSIHYLNNSISYRANASRIYVDMMERPMPSQDLTGFAEHNEGYGKKEDTVRSFGKEALLTLFSYHFKDLDTGAHKQKVMPFFSALSFDEIYNAFYGLTYNRVVEAQEGIVISDVVGEMTYKGSTTSLSYQGNSNETVATYQVTGTIMVEVNADDSKKELYQFTLYIQRAPIQDKVRGYQVIQLEMSS